MECIVHCIVKTHALTGACMMLLPKFVFFPIAFGVGLMHVFMGAVS